MDFTIPTYWDDGTDSKRELASVIVDVKIPDVIARVAEHICEECPDLSFQGEFTDKDTWGYVTVQGRKVYRRLTIPNPNYHGDGRKFQYWLPAAWNGQDAYTLAQSWIDSGQETNWWKSYKRALKDLEQVARDAETAHERIFVATIYERVFDESDFPTDERGAELYQSGFYGATFYDSMSLKEEQELVIEEAENALDEALRELPAARLRMAQAKERTLRLRELECGAVQTPLFQNI